MKHKKPIVAICYDFDGTLSPKYMQEYSFLPGLQQADREDFWKKSNADAKKHQADQILMYMKRMIERAKNSNMQTKRDAIVAHGKKIKFFDGVSGWFKRINACGERLGLTIEHYIVSSGLKEMIEGSKIGDRFKEIYACSFYYDKDGIPVWPAQAVNFTTKTQFLFRINKGITDISDTKKINDYQPPEKRRIPFERMIYLGDGETDIPCMKLVKSQGGYSVAVYDPCNGKKRKDCLKLMDHTRVSCVCPADYRKGSQLDTVVQRMLKAIAANADLAKVIEEVTNSIQQDSQKKPESEQHPTEIHSPTSGEENRNRPPDIGLHESGPGVTNPKSS